MKKNIIYLSWFKAKDRSLYNFGDIIAPYLVSKLSGGQVVFVRFANERIIIIYRFIKGILKGIFRINYIKDLLLSLLIKRYIICAGSIIRQFSSSRCVVWGSGIIHKNDKIRRSTFLAVRGEYTKNRIIELGYKAPQVLGDPALLLPLIYSAKKTTKYRLGIIPHIIHYNYIKEILKSKEILVIKLDEYNPERTIDDICSCKYTISSSLHGLIVSHAYGIKSIWFKIDEFPLFGDNVKFYDYFSSVNIKEYIPFDFSIFINADINDIILLINNSKDINSIKKNIRVIQRNLLEMAPFNVKKKYFELIKRY